MVVETVNMVVVAAAEVAVAAVVVMVLIEMETDWGVEEAGMVVAVGVLEVIDMVVTVLGPMNARGVEVSVDSAEELGCRGCIM